MTQRPYKPEQRKAAHKPFLITIGVMLVLLSGLLSLLVLTRYTDETLAANLRPANAHGTSTVATPSTYGTPQALAPTHMVTPTQAVTPIAPANAELIPVQVRAYTIEGKMADGKMAHSGACAVSPSQFPLGTVLYLYNKADKTFNRKCTAEDTGGDVQDGQIDLAMPGDTVGAMKWGTKDLLARVARRGWGDSNTTLPNP
ncbi:MAG: hypothetical protein NVS2B12_38940 [Ktedonobacteraceae bacterium]